jgi:hypothetical protein
MGSGKIRSIRNPRIKRAERRKDLNLNEILIFPYIAINRLDERILRKRTAPISKELNLYWERKYGELIAIVAKINDLSDFVILRRKDSLAILLNQK